MRAAVDGGIGSQRCEIVADTMSSLSSINVRARIAARIRKVCSHLVHRNLLAYSLQVLGKTSSRPSKSLADNIHWNEIACLTRLCLVANYLPRNGTHAQLFVAEGAHYISLVAGTGQLLVRTSVYGMVVNQLHSVYMARPSGEGTTLSPEIQELLDECARNETLMVFGLFKPTPTSDYVIYDPPNEKQYLDNLEKLGHLLMRIMQAISGSQGKQTTIHFSSALTEFSSPPEHLACSLDELDYLIGLPDMSSHSDPCFHLSQSFSQD